MSAHGYFITGTDTGIGKTLISCALIYKLRKQNVKTIGMKPIAAGADLTSQGLRNEDALMMIQAAQTSLPYELINPTCYAEPIAPHIAAKMSNHPINVETILKSYKQLQQEAEIIIVEGAGGWFVPLNDEQTLATLACDLTLPVILVVGMRLGCLNHALLTQHAIKSSGLTLAGWVANIIDPDMQHKDENIAYLTQHIHAPLLGRINFQENPCYMKTSESLRLPEDLLGPVNTAC